MDRDRRWLWDVLAACRPSLRELARWLEQQPKEELERFARTFEHTKEAIASYSAPPPSFRYLSEDGMEDLCEWIVAQGEALWLEASSSEAGLDAVTHVYCEVEAGRSKRFPRRWDGDGLSPVYDGYRSPGRLAHGLYWSRYGESLRAVIDA